MNQLVLNLSKTNLFDRIPIKEIETISKKINLSVSHYHEKEMIRSASDKAISMFIILEGRLKGVMDDVDGHVYEVEEFSETELTAPANLFSEQERFPVSLIAKTDCRLIEIDKSTLLQMFRLSKKLEENFLSILSRKVHFLASKLWENQFYSIEQKIYKMMHAQYRRMGTKTFDLPYTHGELARRFGVSRPSFSRALIKINKLGIIKCQGRSVSIINTDKLKEKIE